MHRILFALVVLAPILIGVLSACDLFDEPKPLTPEEQARADTDFALVERWKYARFAASYEITGLSVPAMASMSNDGVRTEFTIDLANPDGSRTELTMDLDGTRDRACLRRYTRNASKWSSEACDIQRRSTTNSALFKQDRFARNMFAKEDLTFASGVDWPVTCYGVAVQSNFSDVWHECYSADDVLSYADGIGAIAYIASLRERFIRGTYSYFGILEDFGADLDRDHSRGDLVAGWPDELRNLKEPCCTLRATGMELR